MKWEMVDDRGPRRPSLAVEMAVLVRPSTVLRSRSNFSASAVLQFPDILKTTVRPTARSVRESRLESEAVTILLLQTVTAGSPFHNLHDVESLLWSNGLCLLDGCPLAQPMTLETPRDIWLAGHGCFIAFLDPKSHQRRF
ncbi:hypothetical protein DTO195F2_6870 [Paecilomyces variotii]|nr:hypothetical protein DTO195F2_6870 [Paecilomyces variotii]